MSTGFPSAPLAARAEHVADERSVDVPDDADIARWAAFYEGLPANLRDELDELGREIARDVSNR